MAIKLWYKFGASDDYPSDKKLNNHRPDVEADPDAYYPSLDAELNRSPSRVASGVYQLYDGGAVYQTLATTTERFNRIDVTGRGENVKTAGQATFRANRYLGTVSNVETDRIDRVGAGRTRRRQRILPFHRLQVHFTHLPGYGLRDAGDPVYVWMRVVERTVRDIAPGVYELGLTLMVPAQDEFDDSGGGSGGGGGGAIYALLVNTSGPFDRGTTSHVLFGRTGDELLVPAFATQGPFTFVASGMSGAPWSGITVTDDGTIDVEFVASAAGVMSSEDSPYTLTWSILHNGVAVASYTMHPGTTGLAFFGSWGPLVSVTGLAVTAGDVISARLFHPSPGMSMFRTPWGVNPGVGNNRLEITGGSF